MDGSFVTALVSIVLASDKLYDLVSQIYFALESDPLHPLNTSTVFQQFWYICVLKIRKAIRLAAEHLSPKPNVHTTSLPDPNT